MLNKRKTERENVQVSALSPFILIKGENWENTTYIASSLDGDLFRPSNIVRSAIERPYSFRLTDAGMNTHDVAYDVDTELIKSLSQLKAERLKYQADKVTEWRRNYREAIRAYRQQHTKSVPRYAYPLVRRQRTVTYYKSVPVLYSDAEKLGIGPNDGRSPEILGKLLANYTPSNFLLVELGTRRDVFYVRAKFSRTFWYNAHPKTVIGYKLVRPSKAEVAKFRERWKNVHPFPIMKNDSRWVELTNRIRKFQLKKWNTFRRCAHTTSLGRFDGRPLARYFRAAMIAAGYAGFDQEAERVVYSSAKLLRSAYTPNGAYRATEEPAIQLFSWGARYYTYETTWRSFFSDSCSDGREAALGTEFKDIVLNASSDEPETVSDAFDNAQIALSNLDVSRAEIGEFNAFRSIAELKDYKGMMGEVRGFCHYIETMGLEARATTSFRLAAKAYLMWKFAVEPTISDISILLNNTRSSLLGVRSGLWNVAKYLDLFQDSSYTIRKYVSGLTSASIEDGDSVMHIRAMRDLFSDSATVVNDAPMWDIMAAYPGQSTSDRYLQSGIKLRHRYGSAEEINLNGFYYSPWYRKLRDLQLTPRVVVSSERPVVFGSYMAKVILDALDNSKLSNLIETMKLPTNVWELYPLSFVVDWLMDTRQVVRNIQNILSAASAEIVSTQGIWASFKREVLILVPTYSITVGGRFVGPVVDCGSDGDERLVAFPEDSVSTSKWTLQDVKAYRTGLTAFARGPLEAPNWARALLPHFDIKLDISKLTTLLALLAQT